MKKHSLLIALIAVVLCVGCVVSFFGRAMAPQPSSEPQTQASSIERDDSIRSFSMANNSNEVTISAEEYARFKKMDELLSIMGYVDEMYYQPVDDEKILQGAASGMLRALDDPFSFYYTPEAYAEMWESDNGEYAGVGMQISIHYDTGICNVSRVFRGSPAEEAGLHKGDILYRLGDEMLINAENINDAISQIRGVPGTTVDVTFLRDGKEITLTMRRENIKTNWVDSCMLTDQIGYLMLYEFSGDCAEAFASDLNKLISNGAKGIILDLRDNPGGWLDSAKSIASQFVDEGTLCYLEYRDGYREYYYTTGGKQNVELVILINEGSASASEILTGCLKDRTNATTVGTQSYGKGIVQAVLEVGQKGAGMQLTIAQYFTPNGNAVHKIGITPDVVIPLPEGDPGMYELGDTSDPQLAIALQVMNEKLSGEMAAELTGAEALAVSIRH